MPKAPHEEQLKLVELQRLDRTLAQLAHRRRTHPTVGTLSELGARVEDLDRSRLELDTDLNDARRRLNQAEAATEQVTSRMQRDQATLDGGQVGSKQAQALLGELEVLRNRLSVLEDDQLETLENFEGLEQALAEVDERRTAMAEQVAEVESEQVAAFSELDAEKSQLAAEREQLVTSLATELVEIYERVYARTGGLAVVAVKNGQAVGGMTLSLSLNERAALSEAASDEIVQTEDEGYILVRLDQA